MTDLEQRKRAKEFVEFWENKGIEKSESQQFWTSLLSEVYGVKDIKSFVRFEEKTEKLLDGKSGWIDVIIPSTKVLIEQKSSNIDLDQKIKHGDIEITAFQQAWLYAAGLNYDDRPRWIVTCNFRSFKIYDMNNRNSDPEEVLLKDLPKEYYRLSFLVDSKNEHVKKEEELSFKAGELVGKLYDAFSKQYKDISNEQSQKDLNELCVRLVFCLYAEDAGLFGRKNVFHDYLSKYDDLTLMRENLIKLFKVLDTPIDKRDKYLEEELEQFPYVNGGLFSNENLEIPTFTEEIKDTLLAKASDDFDWSEISPTIFGAVFESTLNSETRRSGGMHYTSIENIHKVIDPLFLDELRERLNEAENYKFEKTRKQKLIEFQNYIASLNFLDPACGSGNFLTETYLSLRRLENEAISVMQGEGVMSFDVGDQIKVSINQFYGIEINDFAVKVAKTALWIAEAQMFVETTKIISSGVGIEDFLPLETYENIVEGNALRINWDDVLLNKKCNYIMGNPPFYGQKMQLKEQKEDMKNVFLDFENYKRLDYVACWFKKSFEYIRNTKIMCALVSTNSICQGEMINLLWKPLFTIYNPIINFAHKTFRWDSEANLKAHVHCVIIGFSYVNSPNKIIYDNGKIIKAENINPYLMNAPTIFIEKTTKSLFGLPFISKGSQLVDGGFYVFKNDDEYKEFLSIAPSAEKYIRNYVNAKEYLNGITSSKCLFFDDFDPSDLNKMPNVLSRIQNVKEFRESSSSPTFNELAKNPMKYFVTLVPKVKSISFPCVSSEKRKYIPMGFIDSGTVCTNSMFYIESDELYVFSLLNSSIHMAWMRVFAGRLKSDYRYSSTMVYNTFPVPKLNEEQKNKLKQAAEAILEARKKYPNSSLADMYGEHMYLYSELLEAHQKNDKIVMKVYGFNPNMSESEIVAKLMKMYQKLIEESK